MDRVSPPAEPLVTPQVTACSGERVTHISYDLSAPRGALFCFYYFFPPAPFPAKLHLD